MEEHRGRKQSKGGETEKKVGGKKETNAVGGGTEQGDERQDTGITVVENHGWHASEEVTITTRERKEEEIQLIVMS